MNPDFSARQPGPLLPWWRVGMVWFALAGPVAVVAAGIVTTVIAIDGADPAVRIAPAAAAAQAPALQVRNHVATGGIGHNAR